MAAPVRHGGRIADRDLLLMMLGGATLREAAALLGSHPHAVLLRRHALLGRLAAAPAPKLGGAVLLVRVPYLLNGMRSRIVRLAVLIACTADGERRCIPDVRAGVQHDATQLLAPHFVAGTTLVHAGPFRGPIATAAPRLGLIYVRRRDAEPAERWERLESVARAHGRTLQVWLRRYRGIAPATLPLYVAWHEALLCVHGAPDPATAWLARWESVLAGTRT